MCDHSNEPGGREAAMVVLDPGTPDERAPGRNRDAIFCDPCMVALVKALNDGGVQTTASCCGHGGYKGWVMLADGRTLTIEEPTT